MRRKWIKSALRLHRKGSLRRTLRRWHLIGKRGKITRKALARGEKRARRTGATHTLRQINLFRTLLKFQRRRR